MTDTTPVVDADMDTQFALKREVLELRQMIEMRDRAHAVQLIALTERLDRHQHVDLRGEGEKALIDMQPASGGTSDISESLLANIHKIIDVSRQQNAHHLGHIYDRLGKIEDSSDVVALRTDALRQDVNKNLVPILSTLNDADGRLRDVVGILDLINVGMPRKEAPWGIIICFLFLIVALLCGILVLLAMNFAGATVPDWSWAGPPSQRL